MEKLREIYLSTYFLIKLNSIKENLTIKNFLKVLNLLSNIEEKSFENHLKAYSEFIIELSKSNFEDFSKCLENCIYETIANKNIKNPENEFEIINNLSKISYENIAQILNDKFPKNQTLIKKLPYFKNSGLKLDETKEIELTELKNKAFDIFENNKAFIFDNDLEIKPVQFVENIRFKDLKEYKEQKRILFENTKALLDGLKVNNILLYGEAGCGKSSSVRALLNEFENLKMVQIFKNNLINLDKLYSKLNNLPYKFIIFADDISFNETDNTFSTMKAILEGSLIQCPKNAVIYATSNRRHLVKENFQSRKGDEVHLNDTLNEISSLSERFGINLLFQKPTNDEFIKIVLELAHDNNINIEDKILIEKAQRIALIKGSKSPRIARQLIDNLLANILI